MNRTLIKTHGMILASLSGLLPMAPAAPAQVPVPAQATAKAPLVLQGVTIIDVKGGQRLPNQTVTIAGTRIQTIGPTNQAHVPRGARVVHAQGKYLIPGLWDMHVHPRYYVDLAFPLFIANGVTGVRDAGSEVPLATLSQWKREIAAGARVGPRYLVSGPALDESQPQILGHSQTVITMPDTDVGYRMYAKVPQALARYAIDSLKRAGADFIKMYSLSHAMYLAMAAEARRIGIPFGGHADDISGIEASDSGAVFLDHEPWLDPNPCWGDSTDLGACTEAARHFRRNNSWVTFPAQLAVLDSLAGQPGAVGQARRMARMRRYVPASFCHVSQFHLCSWLDQDGKLTEEATELTHVTVREPTTSAGFVGYTAGHHRVAREAGLPLLIGTDMNMVPMGYYLSSTPGFAEQQALLGFVLTFGMTPLEALQTATLNPAIAMRATDSLGTVGAGKVADLVLLDADPLTDICNTTKIRAVVAAGRYYDRAALDDLLTEAERVAARR